MPRRNRINPVGVDLEARNAYVEKLFMDGMECEEIARMVGVYDGVYVRQILIERDVLFEHEEDENKIRMENWRRARRAARELLQKT